MSSFGAMDISVKSTPFDILITSSNKCIEGPPGISLVIASLALLTRKMTTPVNSFVLDVQAQWKSFEQTGEWRSTPPTHVIQACTKALELLSCEGVKIAEGDIASYEKILLVQPANTPNHY